MPSSCCCEGGKTKYYEELDSFIKGLPDKEGELITVLHKAQQIFGYLPKDVQEFVADRMDLTLAKVYGVVSFYSFFTMKPKGKYPISVCMGTACYVRGAEGIVEKFEEQLGIKVGGVTEDGMFSLDILRCLGACGLAPVTMIGDKVYGRMTPDKVVTVLQEYRDKEVQEVEQHA